MTTEEKETERLPILTDDEVLKLLTFEREIKPLEQKQLEMLLHMYEEKQASGKALTVLEALWVKRLNSAIEGCIVRSKLIMDYLLTE